MNETLQQLHDIGLVPVVKINDAANAVPLAKALLAGGLPAAEIDRLAPHKVFPGNRPSTTIMYRKLGPRTLGMLLALLVRGFTSGNRGGSGYSMA